MSHNIRLATPGDGGEILAIYTPYVENTATSFEEGAPSIADFCGRVESIAAKYPYLVWQEGGKIIGYAYASKYRERAAYRFDTEVSVYLLPEYQGRGIALRLYSCLFELLEALGYQNAYAICTNPKSISFHRRFGFSIIGTHHKTGYKLGAWHDTLWLEKAIGGHPENPAPVKPIGELPPDYLDGVFRKYSD